MEYAKDIRRGEIYYIYPGLGDGCEMRSGRPGIIVSADSINRTSTAVQVVYLTTQPKRDMLTHVTIRSTDRTSTALCEQVHTVDTDKIGNRYNICTDDEMRKIEAAIMIGLGIETDYFSDDVNKKATKKIAELEEKIKGLEADYQALYKEKEFIEKHFDKLLENRIK